jgi:hypothetical protein
MIITKEVIDVLTPNHGRTSCSDAYPGNGGYEIEDRYFQGIVIERNWRYRPRCNRCFLLDHIGYDTDYMKDIEIVPEIELVLKQPKITVVEEKY